MMKQRKWSVKEQASFLKRTGELLVRGYPLAEAIESLSFQFHSIRKEQLSECLLDLKKGLSFHIVLAKLKFQEDLIGYVYYAEQHGGFAEALLEGSKLALIKEAGKHQLLKLLQYPLMLIVITGFLFFFVEHTLLPRFTSLFKSMNLQTNFFSKVIFDVGHYFPSVFMFLSSLLLMTSIYYIFLFRKFPMLKQKELLVRIPLIGRVLKLLYTHYFSIQLSFLLSGGISFSEALNLIEANRRQPFFSELANAIRVKLVTGEKLESILYTFVFFEKEFPMIVRHGQVNGRLEQELLLYSQHCIAVMEELAEKSIKLIQPALYFIIGFLIVSMYLAILLPMFHLMDGI